MMDFNGFRSAGARKMGFSAGARKPTRDFDFWNLFLGACVVGTAIVLLAVAIASLAVVDTSPPSNTCTPSDSLPVPAAWLETSAAANIVFSVFTLAAFCVGACCCRGRNGVPPAAYPIAACAILFGLFWVAWNVVGVVVFADGLAACAFKHGDAVAIMIFIHIVLFADVMIQLLVSGAFVGLFAVVCCCGRRKSAPTLRNFENNSDDDFGATMI
uniref:Uncharacterized protein n=1 Tax=Marseillevirus LCMAC103 TaxID=2506604 RepID=A0A481YUZ4_9VIRU|nr:MAG: hypothetical protein LCMAC103_00500 [Marseillevirus LCMAC103]